VTEAGARLVMLLAALMAAAAFGARAPSSPPPSPAVLPVSLVDVQTGAAVELGPGPKVLHVVVFATWCPPCEDELPRLAEWEARFGGAGYRLAVVALARRQTRERLLRFARDSRPAGSLFLDASGELEKALGVEGIPAHFLIDGEGRVRLRAGSLAEVDVALLEGMLNGRAPAEDTGP
jgi:thiol-disulfide isomerase/thioredoxin